MTSRKEIAARLREVWDCNGGFFMTTDTAVFQLSDVVGARGKTYEFFFNRLADLIDPTCHVTDEEVTHEPTLNALAVHVYRCDSCDWYFYMAEVCCHPKPFYCPMCGARVVRDEA